LSFSRDYSNQRINSVAAPYEVITNRLQLLAETALLAAVCELPVVTSVVNKELTILSMFKTMNEPGIDGMIIANSDKFHGNPVLVPANEWHDRLT
jgi:hypothetical protein